MALITYCSITDVDAILSSVGEIARLDDDDSGVADAANVTAVIEQATEEVNLYLCRRYEAATLATSAWVKYCTAVVAAWLASRRRGNPPPEILDEEYKRYLEQLKQIQNGQLDVPYVNPQFDMTPATANYTVDSRFDRAKIRKIAATSTGGAQANGRKQFPSVDYLTGY